MKICHSGATQARKFPLDYRGEGLQHRELRQNEAQTVGLGGGYSSCTIIFSQTIRPNFSLYTVQLL